jgi:hypothetical protein
MPQLDVYILSSHMSFILVFFILYFVFLKKILPIFTFSNKIQNKISYSFKLKTIINYLEDNNILNKKYRHFIVLANVYGFVTDFIYGLKVTRLKVPYSIVRSFLLMSFKLEKEKK